MHRLAIALAASSLLATSVAFAAGAPVKSDVPASLSKEAKISLETARATALAKVPHGVIRSEELEREHGKLIYSFDIAVPGKLGIQEVNVSLHRLFMNLP
jgi:uncharacterized membrane protein YkoI